MGELRNTMILIVEDDERVRDLCADVLKGSGYYVAQASNGVEALQVLAVAKSVSLVLTDIWMPTMHGCALIEAIRSDPSLAKVPILIMTGDVAPIQVPAGIRVVQKPFRVDDLLDAVNTALTYERRQSERVRGMTRSSAASTS